MRANRLAGFAVLPLVFALGCTGASGTGGGGGGGAGGAGGGSGADDGWEHRTHIEATFESSCSGCHGSQWTTCWDVQASRSVVESVISSGEMPRFGTLAPSEKSTVLAWLKQGAPCDGTRPKGSSSSSGGGGFLEPPEPLQSP